MLIDIGVNLSNSQYKNDVEDVLMRAQEAGVEKMVLTGTSIAESEAVISLCEQYKERFPQMLYCTVGIHPHEAGSFNSQSTGVLKEYSNHDSVVAIGETGLDFNRNFSSKQDQEKAFEQQIEIAVENKMPLFLHERDA
ncbi:MAG: hydrolase TatD, partial [Porticoccaceae bacterium]|nr:hydrolase TatD [Porticoccaceae bacterium]